MRMEGREGGKESREEGNEEGVNKIKEYEKKNIII